MPIACAFVWVGWGAAGFWGWEIAGVIIGFLIELFAVPIFHASQRPVRVPKMHPAM